MFGITYKDKHSYNDFGLTIKSKEISPPPKEKIKSTVPFMQGSYDFSNLYDDQTYGERTLNYVFNLTCNSKTELNIKKIRILDWLLNSFKDNLEDDTIPGFYFSAECEDANFKEDGRTAEITAKFSAYPFKYRTYDEGKIPWDEFDFELDYMQDTKFDISEIKTVEIYNQSAIKITPTIICSSAIDIVKDNITYKFNAGTTKDWRFNLDAGLNSLTLKGTGSLEFVFRREVL